MGMDSKCWKNAALLFVQAGYRLRLQGTATHGLEAHGT
jgi:hypothetical protein